MNKLGLKFLYIVIGVVVVSIGHSQRNSTVNGRSLVQDCNAIGVNVVLRFLWGKFSAFLEKRDGGGLFFLPLVISMIWCGRCGD